MSCIFLQEDIQKLFLNKHVVVMGGSIQRSVYKDLVRLLQGNVYLKDRELRLKGEETMLNDKLTFKSQVINGPGYREEREYMTDHYFLKFIFLTRCYNAYLESILKDFADAEFKPDVIIINSCLWDLTSYGGKGRNNASAIIEYKENLDKMFKRFKETLPECLCIWNTNPPIAQDCKGGVFVPGTEDLKSIMGLHLLEANVYAQKLASSHGFEVIDLYYYLMNHIHRRAEDGIHWDMTAHRRITNLILTHISEAWEIDLPKHLENARKYSENKTSENEIKENKTDDNQNKENITALAQDDTNNTETIEQRTKKPKINKNNQNKFRRGKARGGTALRRAVRFPRIRGQSQKPIPQRSNSPSLQNMNEAFVTNQQYYHDYKADTVKFDYNHGFDYNYDENDNYEYHTESQSSEYNLENEYDTNYNYDYHSDYNHEEYFPPVEPPPRNRYAEDHYSSSIAEKYYQSTQPQALWQEDRWSPYNQYPHHGKIHPAERGHIHRYMPYGRRPPW
ncbi:hypothetical protein KUTeg_005608 [Tegillarca granosa]|uniref:PC-esterase domain-containing protein 1A n=1 Tax=Tegillarca granosa TaxID=220873 RepID=A0ABQ9FKB1_TEGGR|nr:hypothetical protein KUTeg_005608 [Tegillarca granosa]